MLNITAAYLTSKIEADREFASRRRLEVESASPPTRVRTRMGSVLIRTGARLIPQREEAVMGRVIVLPTCCDDTATAA